MRDTKILEQYKDIPYTMVGSSCLLPQFMMLLTAKGLKAILKKCNDDDLVRITVFTEKQTQFEIIKQDKK